MRDLNDLSVFVAVVSNGGISAAARSLGAPKSKISRRVAALEDQLGLRLVERTTRRFKVTEVGQDVYRHARAALAEAEAIDEMASRQKAEPQGLVRVSCPIGVERMIGRALPPLLARHPQLRVQLVVTNRRVELIDENIDIAVRVRAKLDSDADLQVKIIRQTDRVLVASPAFIAANGSPSSPAELPSFATISQTDRPGPDRWTLSCDSGEEIDIVHEPRMSATAFPVLRQAAIDGVGIAMLPEYACLDYLEAGELVRVLPAWSVPQGILHLVFTSRRGLLPGVRAVIDLIAEVLHPRSEVWLHPAESGM
ncbi:MAG: LysR family transcriptional regulator [Caulobacteraceae bacterium]|nr:LysR family transcriptional regulator [Caulobacteraceae bacterium]